MSEPSEHMEHASPACPHCAAAAEAATPEPAEMAAECRAAPEPPEAETEAAPHACCCRHKVRTPEEHKALLNRLSRIEGQIRGIRGMVEKDVYCADILVQVAAANSALNSFWASTSAPVWRMTCGPGRTRSWTSCSSCCPS